MKNQEIKKYNEELTNGTMETTMDLVTKATALICELSEEEMLSKNRERHLVDARRIAYAVNRLFFKYPLLRIGKFYKKNHATIIHQVNVHNAIIQYDKDYAMKYQMVLNCVRDEVGLEHIQEYKDLMDKIYNTAFKRISQLSEGDVPQND